MRHDPIPLNQGAAIANRRPYPTREAAHFPIQGKRKQLCLGVFHGNRNSTSAGLLALAVCTFLGTSLAANAGTWSSTPWAGDSTSNIHSGQTQWAYHFGSAATATVNGFSVPGLGTQASFSTAQFDLAVTSIYQGASNNLTALGGSGSAVMAGGFIYNGIGNPGTATVKGLTAGQSYVVSFYGVGFDPSGSRSVNFSSGSNSLVVDQDAYGYLNGVRVDYSFTATASTQSFTFAETAHLYSWGLNALSLRTQGSATTGLRTSTSYNVVAESSDSGGRRTTSAAYTNVGSIGSVTGTSSAASPAETAKMGYIAQLYDVTGLQLTASPATVSESGTRQLSAAQVLDDATTLAITGTSIIWSMPKGPLVSISDTGLATAGIVGQNTSITVQGSYLGLSGSLGLTVLDSIPDNFGSYASDGLPDSWQLQYFGSNNPLAAPTADATGTGQNNLFKYTAGLNPIDPSSRFVTSVGPAAGSHTLTISPRLSDRSYTIQYSMDLSANGWQTLTGATIQDNGQTRTVTDTDGTSTRKFYRVQVSYP